MWSLWNRFNEDHVQVVRIAVDDGRRFLGRQISQRDLADTLNRLNVQSTTAKMTGREIVKAVNEGKAVIMSNGWTMKKVRVSNENRIEIDLGGKFLSMQAARQITESGGIYERIGWEGRYFIPTDEKRGGDAMAAIMQKTGSNAVTVKGGEDALRERLGTEAVTAVISEAPQNDSEEIQALYLGEAKRKKLLNEFLIPARSGQDGHRDKPYRKVEVLVVCDMLLTGFDAPILQALYLDKKLLNHSLLQTIARVNRPYNEMKGHGLVLDYYGIFDHLNEALNYKPDELGDVAFPFDTIREHFRNTFQQVWALFPQDTVPRDGSHDAFITAMKILRDVDGTEKQFDAGYRNLRVLYEALQPDEQLRDFVRPYAWLTKLYMLYRKKFYPDASKSIEATEEDAARTRELIREHIDVDELEAEFPTYVLDEHFLTKLKDKKPDAKALDIEAMLSAELRIHLDQDESFRPLSEKLQRIIDEKRAGTLAGIALIEELESLTEAVRTVVEEAKRPT